MKIDDDTLIAYLDAQLEDDAAYEAVTGTASPTIHTTSAVNTAVSSSEPPA